MENQQQGSKWFNTRCKKYTVFIISSLFLGFHTLDSFSTFSWLTVVLSLLSDNAIWEAKWIINVEFNPHINFWHPWCLKSLKMFVDDISDSQVKTGKYLETLWIFESSLFCCWKCVIEHDLPS